MKLVFNACIVLLIYSSTSVAAEQHKAAKMLAPAKVNKSTAAVNNDSVRKNILKSFEKAYDKEGTPSIAIFWNRKFDDQLSQWYQDVRLSQTGETSAKASDKFEPKSGDKPGYERNVSGGGKIVSAQYEESRVKEQERNGFQESESFDFSAGFTTTFLSVPAKIIDRQAIMRLIQRDNSEEAGAEMISDYQKIETDALIGYAEFLAEVLLTPDPKGDTGWAFMVTVKSVSNGQVIAMFKSTGNKPLEGSVKEKWVSADSGYEKQTPKREIGHPQEVGEQLAYEVMESLTKAWK